MSKIEIIPLGGLEEVGKNMTVVRFEDEMYIVDAGLTFPENDLYGVDVIIPDFDYVRKNVDKLKGIIITHAHEDHIGALPYFLKEFKVPVYTSKLTAALIRNKLRGSKVPIQKLHIVNHDSVIAFEKCKISFFRTIHSIPDSLGVVIETPLGNVVHTGDFKVDYAPLDKKYMDFYRLSEIGKKGVLVMLSDSTNATKEGVTISEQKVKRTLESIISQVKGKIILATFSSSMHRLQNVFEIAHKLHKKVFINGKTMEDKVKIASKLKYMRYVKETQITAKELEEYEPNDVIVIATGAQGESSAGLMKMVNGINKTIKVEKGDTVIFSSSPIQGNEKSVNKLVNLLLKKGVNVVNKGEIHTSGHGNKEEQKLMLSIFRPKFFIPVHGDYNMMKTHGESAEEIGVRKENILICENGDVIEVTPKSIRKNGKVKADSILVDNSGLGDVNDNVMRDRKRMATQGTAVVLAEWVEGKDGKEKLLIKTILKGISGKYEKKLLNRDVKKVVEEVFVREKTPSKPSQERKDIYIELSNIIYKHLKKKPLIVFVPSHKK